MVSEMSPYPRKWQPYEFIVLNPKKGSFASSSCVEDEALGHLCSARLNSAVAWTPFLETGTDATGGGKQFVEVDLGEKRDVDGGERELTIVMEVCFG
jgi:hypothetical protein